MNASFRPILFHYTYSSSSYCCSSSSFLSSSSAFPHLPLSSRSRSSSSPRLIPFVSPPPSHLARSGDLGGKQVTVPSKGLSGGDGAAYTPQAGADEIKYRPGQMTFHPTDPARQNRKTKLHPTGPPDIAKCKYGQSTPAPTPKFRDI